AVKLPVLNDQRDVVDAVAARQLESRLLVVIDDEHSGEAAVDVPRSMSVWVWVIPQGRGRLIDEPVWFPGLAGRDGLMWSAVHLGRKVHSVPVQAAGLIKVVSNVDFDLFASCSADRRGEVRSVDAPRRRCSALPQVYFSTLHG